MAISLQSTIKLRSGAKIPQLGYGVYQARGEECEKGVAEALRLGYAHIDSAQVYRNEDRASQLSDI
jgi:diketogulonate reductase-like aldo/keto reductase